ncbi:50S ribosomal protein L24 [Candidatus Kaiserbacteria bacterium CG10_big_fil_rev_8_21_14_0_10_45_20]|uniref:Large ribosomal subunit protein uL24 n=1 Tax=Candidatus Kaiserbacteria bacterium CG10_big_fil_rev_8_21_14_0_10_45_20 TaxID=1974607 RepID=A0A2H0UFI7_9BACT|nr:MAG: 50S ribosomal protein L24 [Candidatus Kaiserbacteria bacterium CG10_big_fil_rev_8_21_14_0_10_45_20]
MKIKKGDKVVVISGKDKGKAGVVSRALPLDQKVIVGGVNVRKKHKKPQRGVKGTIISIEMPIAVSNVMLVDPKSGKRTRVGIVRKDGVRTRVTKKGNQEI